LIFNFQLSCITHSINDFMPSVAPVMLWWCVAMHHVSLCFMFFVIFMCSKKTVKNSKTVGLIFIQQK